MNICTAVKYNACPSVIVSPGAVSHFTDAMPSRQESPTITMILHPPTSHRSNAHKGTKHQRERRAATSSHPRWGHALRQGVARQHASRLHSSNPSRASFSCSLVPLERPRASRRRPRHERHERRQQQAQGTGNRTHQGRPLSLPRTSRVIHRLKLIPPLRV